MPNIPLTSSGQTYFQNFDTLSNTAGSTTNTLTISGWELNETGGGARDNEQYGVDTGGSTTGDTYSYGATGATDRALGGLRSGTLIPVFGAGFVNSTGGTITSLLIGYTGEEWRLGTAGRTDRLDFQISFDATSVTTGNWTDVDQLDFTTPDTVIAGAKNGNAAAERTVLSNSLTTSIASGATFFIRWTDVDATGADDGLAVDDFSLTATATAAPVGNFAIANLAGIAEGNSGTTNFDFVVTRNGGSAGAVSIPFTVDSAGLTNGATGADFAATSGTVTFADGITSAVARVIVNGDSTAEFDENFRVTLGTPSAGSVTTATATGTILNDDGAPITVSIADASVLEGNSGQTSLNFTVTRSGGTGAFSVNYITAGGTATEGSDYLGTSGTLNFADGVTSLPISVVVNGDTAVESTETFSLTLSGATNDAILTRAVATGRITDDDTVLTQIHDIQGTSYFSPYVAAAGINAFGTSASTTVNATSTTVTVRGIVTALDNVGARQGFFITADPATWDANNFTSEGIFVMTHTDNANVGVNVSGVAVGDLVTVTANVMEYQGFATSMPITALVNPTFTVDAQNQTLPILVLDATHPIPNDIITGVTPDYKDSVDDPGDTFDASLYALSFYETVEGMLVTVPSLVVADSNVLTSGGQPYFKAYSTVQADAGQINTRGGYTIAGDPPLSPPDTASTSDDTRGGGRYLTDGDTNPDILEVDFSGYAANFPISTIPLTSITMGDRLGDVTGIIEFDFSDLKLYVTNFNVGSFVDNTVTKETATLAADTRALSFATFNVENLGGNAADSRFTAIANAIVNNLHAPDILSIEEIQDNNGAAAGDGTSSTGTDASATWGKLIAALNIATGGTALGAVCI